MGAPHYAQLAAQIHHRLSVGGELDWEKLPSDVKAWWESVAVGVISAFVGAGTGATCEVVGDGARSTYHAALEPSSSSVVLPVRGQVPGTLRDDDNDSDLMELLEVDDDFDEPVIVSISALELHQYVNRRAELMAELEGGSFTLDKVGREFVSHVDSMLELEL